MSSETRKPSLRASNLAKLEQHTFDVLVVGGGINGAVSAAALAGKGARVGLIDKGDFAGETSQESSNLAWGGIKYLEGYEFGLVYKLCKSRNLLMRSYPSTVQEIRFFTTIAKGFRKPKFLVYLGALLYWFIGAFFTRRPRLLTRKIINREEGVVKTEGTVGGLEYSDAYLHDNDARFVFNFLRSAMNYGCIASNYVSAGRASRSGGDLWTVSAKDEITGRTFAIRAKCIVNACGPFADQVNETADIATEYRHVLSKGIHLIVDRVTPNKRVLTFFADDGRLFFAIPMGNRTCIGTTDTRVETPHPGVSQEDRDFVLENINKRLNLAKPLTMDDVIAERCGVRPLAVAGGNAGDKDWVQLSRKHVIEINEAQKQLTIFGGKLTDCINVGNEVADAVKGFGVALPHLDHVWYGEPPASVREEFLHQAKLMRLDEMTPASSSEPLSARLWRRYGSTALTLLEDIRRDPAMAELLIQKAEYIRCEIEQTARREMVTKLEDFLRRRSKIALVVPHEELRRAPGLKEVCRIFFGDEADMKWSEYFDAGGTAALPAEKQHPSAQQRISNFRDDHTAAANSA